MHTDIESDFPGKNILKLQYVSPHGMEAFRRFCRLSRKELIRYLTDKCNVYLDDDSNDRKEIVSAKLESLKKDLIFSKEEQEFFPVFVPLERDFFSKVFGKKMRPQIRKDIHAIQEREDNLRRDGVFDRIDAWQESLPEDYAFSPNDLLSFLPEGIVDHFRNHLKENGIELNESLLREIGDVSYENPVRRQEWGLRCQCADCASFEGDYQTIWDYVDNRIVVLRDSK